MNFDKKRYIQSKLDYAATGKATCPHHAIVETFRMRRLFGWRKTVDMYHPDWFEEQFIAQTLTDRSSIKTSRRIEADEREEVMCLSNRQLAIQAGRAEHFINRNYPDHKAYVILVESNTTLNIFHEDRENKTLLISLAALRKVGSTELRGITNVEVEDLRGEDVLVKCGIRIHPIGRSRLYWIDPNVHYHHMPIEEIMSHVSAYKALRMAF